MANKDADKKDTGIRNKAASGRFNQLKNLMGQLKLNLYGTDRNPDTAALDSKFQDIISRTTSSYMGTPTDNMDTTSFLANLTSSTDKLMAGAGRYVFKDISMNDVSNLGAQLGRMYENRLREKADLNEVATTLIELNEAISVTRDAIVSAESVEGRLSRTIKFENKSESDSQSNLSMVEMVERKFKLQDKIKNFIVPKTLTYGEYYAYVVPYSKLFNDIAERKQSGGITIDGMTLRESVMTESESQTNKASSNSYIRVMMEKYKNTEISSGRAKDSDFGKDFSSDFNNTINTMLENVTICNEAVPIPILENGDDGIIESLKYKAYTEVKHSTDGSNKPDLFNAVTDSGGVDGTYIQNDNPNKKNEFEDIKDCYIRLMEPTRVIPIKIMDNTIGYYYVVSEDMDPVTGILGAKIKNKVIFGTGDAGAERTIIDDIAAQIVKSFNKDFLQKNLSFKKLIVDALTYHDITENRLRFQFIPAEYMVEFKIDCDENGNGQSMIKKSLFYAKLYLTLLLFKMMSVINYSNDTRVNYVRVSGISKDIANQTQEIARQRQSRQVNMHDLFSLTTMANKVGSGREMVIPMSASGDKPMETEVLAGQEVQINTDLMEQLKNSYILGTGVPAAIINYLNEADFAKTIEQNNTKYHARCVNYQLDFNPDITTFYRKVLQYSTSMDISDINNLTFTLTQPRSANAVVKAESINNFATIADFVWKLKYGENDDGTDPLLPKKQAMFKLAYAKEQLPQLRLDDVEKIMRDVEAKMVAESNKPDPTNGEGDDDIGLGDFDDGEI